MSQFYFHIRSNGILMEDQAGCAYKARPRHAPLRSALCLAFSRKPFKAGVHT